MFKRFILFLIIIFCLFFILNFLGWQGGFYYTTNWYDKILHFSAGICVVLAAWWLVDILEKAQTINKKSFLLKIFISLLFLLVIAVLWEVFEFIIDKVFDFPLLQKGPRDTLWDLIFDIIGGSVGIILISAFHFYRGKFVVK